MAEIIRINAITEDRDGSVQVDFELDGAESSVVFDSMRRLSEVEGASPLHSPAEVVRLALTWWLSRDPSAE